MIFFQIYYYDFGMQKRQYSWTLDYTVWAWPGKTMKLQHERQRKEVEKEEGWRALIHAMVYICKLNENWSFVDRPTCWLHRIVILLFIPAVAESRYHMGGEGLDAVKRQREISRVVVMVAYAPSSSPELISRSYHW